MSPHKDSFIKTTFSKSALAWLGTLGTLALFIYLSAYNGGYFSLDLYASSVGIWALTGLVLVILWDEVKMPFYTAVPLLALAAIAIWTAVSTSWSISPNYTIQEFGRVALYFACFLMILTGPKNKRSVWLTIAFFVLICIGLALFALLAKIIPDYSQQYAYSGGRLMGSIGYWNGLAGLMVMALLPCLWLASSSQVNWAGRVGATIGLVILGTTLFFTLSRGGILIGIFATVAYLALAPQRLGALLAIFSSLIPGVLLVLYTLTSLPSLQTQETGAPIDPSEGKRFALALLLALAAATIFRTVTLALPSRVPPTRAGIVLIVVFWSAVITTGGVIAFSQRDYISNKLSEWQSKTDVQVWQYDQGSVDTRGVERLASTADHRTEFWYIGIKNFLKHPLLGTGGGTYRFANAQLRSSEGLARDPHSLWVRFLSDQGLIGFLLLLALVATLGWTFVKQLKANTALAGDGLYLALGIACLAWLADSTLEWNWALPAVSVPFFLLAALMFRLGNADDFELARAASSFVGKQSSLRTMPSWLRGSIAAAAMFLTIFFLALLMSKLDVNRAEGSLIEGDLAAAETAARKAHQLNYFSVEPLYLLAKIAEARGDYPAARDFIMSAIDREPEKSALYEDLALIQFYGLKDTAGGLKTLSQAIDLDPQYNPLHLQLHRMYADAKKYSQTKVMPERPAATQY